MRTRRGVTGYIGGNTLMEMAFAYAQKLELFLLKPVPDMSYTDEILGMKPMVLNGDVSKIDAYFKQLPRVLVSSKSPVKLSAISRGMRRAGIRTQVIAFPTESNVSEQPMSIDEIYEGAMSRQKALIEQTRDQQPDYYATMESGQHVLHKNHNSFGCHVIIIERKDGVRKVGISTAIEYPKEMTDKVPSVYPDFGVLVQKEYGSQLKDPYPYFTGGKLTRRKLAEEAVFNVAVQFPRE